MNWIQAQYHVDEQQAFLLSRTKLSTHRAAEPPPPPHLRTDARSRASVEQQMKLDRAQTPKCEPSYNTVTTAGSNAFQRRKTCLACGAVTMTKVERPLLGAAASSAASACSHANTTGRVVPGPRPASSASTAGHTSTGVRLADEMMRLPLPLLESRSRCPCAQTLTSRSRKP